MTSSFVDQIMLNRLDALKPGRIFLF